MNSFIETLNQWSENFLSFGWPMLWQSSLLIAALFAFDFLFRRKLRASIRYALWLVILVKLCVPPTLALPTSPAWWLHRTPPLVVITPATHYTVTYDNAPLTETPQVPLPVFVPPKPTITNTAWLLVVSAAVSSALLGWLLVRWWQITRQVSRAKTSERLAALADETQTIVGMKFKVQVKLTTNSMSPAVCGLFRPAILIPQTLVEKFSDEQLRAVLLHELIHLRRRDVWVNFVQALLQIFYWWHPLVWLANVRIRRVREEAVDDAVMLALRDESESYAPTLLEVAKLALNRPLASLGLVGIMESHHALRQRIERLVDFRPPRQAGLTLVSLLGILAFTAVAVPMGEGPGPTEEQPVSLPTTTMPKTVAEKTIPKTILVTSHFYWLGNAGVEKIISGLKLNSSASDSSWPVSPEKLSQITDALRSSSFSEFAAPRVVTINHETATVSVSKGTNGIYVTCTPNVTNGLVNLVIHCTVNESSIRDQFNAESTLADRGGIVIRAKSADEAAESNLVVLVSVQIDPTNFSKGISQGNTDQLVQDGKLLYEMGKLDDAESKLKAAIVLSPDNQSAQYYLDLVEQARKARFAAKILPPGPPGHMLRPTWEISAVTNYVGSGRQKIVAKLNNIRFDSISYDPPTPLSEVLRDLFHKIQASDPEKKGINFIINNKLNDTTSGNDMAGSDEPGDIGSYLIKLDLKDVRVADVLDAIVLACNHPIKYSILDYGIIFSLKDESPPLFERTFKVDTNTFYNSLREQAGSQINDVSTMARNFFKKLGVDMESPAGKSVVYNDRLGLLFVRATDPDLDTIERVIQSLNQVTPQIHIKARFIEVPKGTVANFGSFLNSTNSTGDTFTGILTATNMKIILHSLESRKGVEILAEPEVTTTSGRQTQMRETQIITVVTNYAFKESLTNGAGSIVPEMSTVEIGPILDVVPYVLSDGYTINLTLIPSLTEFLGYDKPPDEHLSRNDNRVQVPVVLPRFSIRQVVTTLNLWDDQTVVLGVLKKNYFTVNGKAVARKSDDSDKEIVVFITATIVDPAGNRVHAEEELPFAQNGIPTQPSQLK